jgi:very-short-patch-repair endonuclease
VRRLTSAERLSRLIDRLPSRAVPGWRLLLDLLAERGGGIGHRSGEERKVKRWLRAAGVDGFRFNVHIPVDGGRTIERDFVWWDHKALLEVSPFITHGTEEQQARDIEDRRALVAAGWRIIEATDADLVDRRAFAPCLAALRHVLSTPPA